LETIINSSLPRALFQYCPQVTASYRLEFTVEAAVNVRFGSLADISTSPRDVRFTPNSGHDLRCHPSGLDVDQKPPPLPG
jgi:hypothetical protein